MRLLILLLLLKLSGISDIEVRRLISTIAVQIWTIPVDAGYKGTDLSDAERLGECSMSVKAFWPGKFEKNKGRPKISMVTRTSPIELYTAP
jgi:hypothetical protein